MGLLCLSRQNERARKVRPVLHGWRCVLRLPGRPSCILHPARAGSQLLDSAVFLFPLPWLPCCLPLPAGQSRGKPTPMVYSGICLIARVVVCVFLTVFVVGLFFFFLFWFLFCFAFPAHICSPCVSRCWMPKSERKGKLCNVARMLQRFSWKILSCWILL